MCFELILPFFPDELRTLLLDPSISDLMINGTTGVYADRGGVVEQIMLSTPYSNDRLQVAIERVARILGQDLTSQNPILNTRLAEQDTVPVRIKQMTDAEVIEAQLIENLQRRDVHPMEEAQGFRALLDLEEPKYSIEQIAVRTGKTASYIAGRLKLTELVPAVVDAFYKTEIGVGHALLLAKLQPMQQEQALPVCFREDWSGAGKNRNILLPVRNLQFWIEQNVMLILK